MNIAAFPKLPPESMVVDLHTHSTASDGTMSPMDLVSSAVRAGVSVLALTDHDTTDGNHDALRAAEQQDIIVLPGIELSTQSDVCTAHMLGIGIYTESPLLQTLLNRIREGRTARNHRIIQKLNLLGYRIDLAEVAREAGGEIIGRPHIARTMVRKGFFPSIQACFAELLDRNGAAYVQRFRPNIREAINAIHESEGVAILAHPGLIRLDNETTMQSFIRMLAAEGLDGLECNYPMHSVYQLKYFKEIAESCRIIPTGGSDFHGQNKEHGILGIGVDQQQIGFEYAESLLVRLRSNQQLVDQTLFPASHVNH